MFFLVTADAVDVDVVGTFDPFVPFDFCNCELFKKDGMNEYLNHFGKKIRKQKLNHGLLLVHVGEGKVRPVIPKSYDQISSRGTANECGT